ncbi:MAG: RluA family pseudouridine synthase [Clostridia bacterium]|nr:RluA family pseudouridine synthase [Clostridia bacterium]
MNILFQDDAVLVAIKPQGVLSQSDEKGSDSMVELLIEQTGGVIFPVHRLDRTTLGLMVFAKTQAAVKNLSAQIADHRMKKVYVAAVRGTVLPESGSMTDLLYYDRRKNKSFVVKRQRNGVKKAVLNYCVTEQRANTAVLRIELETGRTHQIRVQCASRGFPLLGDHRYGADDNFHEIALCAAELTFDHPKTGKSLTFDLKSSPEFDLFARKFDLSNE